MNTREYLGQLKNIDRRIDDKLDEARRWYSQAISLGGGGNNPDRVQTSKKYDKMGDAVAYYLDCSNEANELAYKLAIIKKTIIKQIDGINEPTYYAILKGHYLQNKSLTDLGIQENYSDTQIRRLFTKSLVEFEQKYGSTYLQEGGNGKKRQKRT